MTYLTTGNIIILYLYADFEVEMKKDKKWIKLRHKIITAVLRPVIGTYTRLRYNVTVEKVKDSDKRQYLLVTNHQTGLDQFIMGMAIKRPVYYIASEDLFSNGFVSKLLRWAVAPIPIKKQTTDVHAVMTCLRVAKEGGNIALAPEGNRTFSGKTGYYNPALIKLMKKLNLPMAIMRIEKGYGVQPRWSDVVRKGKMRAVIARIIEPGEYKAMKDDELYALVAKEMYVDDNNSDTNFKSDKRAEYIERAMYVCPNCGLTTFESNGNEVTCVKCGLKATYNENITLSGENWPYRTPGEWYEAQCKYINSLDILSLRDELLYDEHANLSEVILYKHKKPLCKNVNLKLLGDRLEIKGENLEMNFPFKETAAFTVLGKNKLNIYFGDKVYQLKSNKRFNALKYVNLFHRYKNVSEGNENGEFLGL